VWNGTWSTVVCIPCTEAPAATGAASGSAGRSAREEARRRRARQAATRPAGRWRPPLLRRIERLLRRAREAGDAGASWEAGAGGEERVAALLDAMAREQVVAALHDRAIPRSRGNIDHIVVTAAGVWVLDAKAYAGRIDLAPGGDGGVRLVIGGRDRTRLTDGVRKQADHVRRALGPTYREAPVRGALCFVGARRARGLKPQDIDDVLVTWDRELARTLSGPGPHAEPWRASIANHLARRFPPAG
jgi:hypothetical protein